MSTNTEKLELIAKFMGNYPREIEIVAPFCYDLEDASTLQEAEELAKREMLLSEVDYFRELRYDNDWNLLMGVVKKINEQVFAGGILYELRDALITANLEKAFEEVCDVIEIINNRTH